jgi:hypothetical protein
MRSLNHAHLICLMSIVPFFMVPCAVAQSVTRKPVETKPAEALAFSHALSQKPPESKPAEAFAILQKHYFLGRWKVFVSKDKVKAVNLAEDYSIVTMAPTWKVVFYRDSGGVPKMYQTTMREFLIAGIPLGSYYTIEGHLEKAKQVQSRYKGLNALRFDMIRLDRRTAKPAWTLADMPKESPVVLSHYWVSAPISNDDKLCNFVQKLFLVPKTKGYPVAFTDIRADHSHTAVLDILSCKGSPLGDVKIEYPTPGKYKVCQSARDITLSSAKKDSFNEWADAIGKD